MSGLLLGVGEGSPPDAFFSSLCEAICHLTAMRRAVLFRYDSDHRRVRAVGAHGIELERFAELFVTIDSVPVARRALSRDRVLEVLGTADFDVPSSLREPFEDALIVCTPMAAARRYVGVVLSERDAAAPPMGEDERNLLWTLGKAIAMASVAREVTASDERSRQLQQRIDLAREIHDGVVQRLFGVSLALSQPQPLDRRDPAALRRRGADRARRPADRAAAPARALLAPDGRDVRRRARARAGPASARSRSCCRPAPTRTFPRTSRRSRSRCSSRPCATRASTRAPASGGGVAAQRRAHVRARGAQTTSSSAAAAGAAGSVFAWRRLRRCSSAACSSTASPSREPGRCAWSCRPARAARARASASRSRTSTPDGAADGASRGRGRRRAR